jgi:single-strand DNA-binding protein
VNKVILIGHLAADPEVRETKNGAKMAIFPLATNRDWVDSEKATITTDFHKVVAWRQLATIAEKYLTKGMGVYVEGRLMNRTYEAPDKTKRFVTEIVLDNLNMLTWKKKDGVEQINIETPEEQ